MLEMQECARLAKPFEGCALLFGSKVPGINSVGGTTTVTYVVERVDCIPSATPSLVSFVIEDYATFLERWKLADTKGYKFLGVFHSHPAPAEPSGTDLKNMRWMDENNFKFAIWVIQSLIQKQTTNAFIYMHNQVFRVPILLGS